MDKLVISTGWTADRLRMNSTLGQSPPPAPKSDSPSEVETAMEDLVARLNDAGYSAVLHERVPYPVLGAAWWEDVFIFIGAGAATTLLNAAVTDVYNIAKLWARERFKAKETAKREEQKWVESIFIHTDDYQIVVRWKMGRDGKEQVESHGASVVSPAKRRVLHISLRRRRRGNPEI